MSARPVETDAFPETADSPGLLLLPPEKAAALDREAAAWPELVLSDQQLSELELRLSVPALDLPAFEPAVSLGVDPGTRLALRDTEGVLLAAYEVTDVVAQDEGGSHLRGRVSGVRLPAHADASDLRRTPETLLAEIRRRGWSRVHTVVTDRALFEPDLARLEEVLEGAEAADGIVVLLLAGGVSAIDPEHHTRVAAVRAGLATLPVDRTLLSIVPVPPSSPPDRRAAVVEAYGLTALSGRRRPDVSPASGSPSDDEVRAALEGPSATTSASVRPEPVLAVLRRTTRPRAQQGLTVFFTGLSGSGKSTLAGLLAVRLLERGDRSVLLLDGDQVRRHLSKGLGFSTEDRNTNVARIGWVAAQVSAAGGIAVCAPIAPYDATRKAVRTMVETVSPAAGFVLVHVATPLEECARRDRKGLYARAFAGDLPGFTGVSDPYEEPHDADVVVDTTGREPEEIVRELLGHLSGQGWLDGAGL